MNTRRRHRRLARTYKYLTSIQTDTPQHNANGFVISLPTWEEYEAGARATASVDYDCRISGGVCKAGRGCCGDCAGVTGWLNSIRPGTANEYMRLFDPELGFFRPGVGCILPRERRAFGCLAWVCYRGNTPEFRAGIRTQVTQLFQIQGAKPL